MLYFVASRGHPLLPLSFFVSESTALVASWYVQIIFAIHEFSFWSLRAGGILQILQSDWFRERAVFYDLPANPGGIVGSFRHKFVCCLWMSKTRDF